MNLEFLVLTNFRFANENYYGCLYLFIRVNYSKSLMVRPSFTLSNRDFKSFTLPI
jgi:hypothetical protein